VAALASPRVALSAEAVPYRPHRGIHVRLDEVADPHGPWFEGEHLAALAALPGVAGAWTFRRGPVAGGAGEHRITVAWLDAEPLDATAAIATLPEPRAGSVRRCFDGPLASIEPYRWDWFD